MAESAMFRGAEFVEVRGLSEAAVFAATREGSVGGGLVEAACRCCGGG